MAKCPHCGKPVKKTCGYCLHFFRASKPDGICSCGESEKKDEFVTFDTSALTCHEFKSGTWEEGINRMPLTRKDEQDAR